MKLNKIYNESCLETLSRLDTGSVDLVFSDPPYNKNKDYEVYKDNLTDDNYQKFVYNFIQEYRRISNDKIAIFIAADLIKDYWDLLPDAKLIICRKGAIGTPFNDYYRQYFGLLVTAKANETIYDLWWDIRFPGEGYFYREERFPNPGQTSLKLTQRVINYFSKQGDLIYDGFMGCGTTAVAAKSLGRNYIGSELNPRYIEIAKSRLKRFNQTDLFIEPAGMAGVGKQLKCDLTD